MSAKQSHCDASTHRSLFRAPTVVSMAHSLMVISVLLCLLTGFRIATIAEAIGWLAPLDQLLPQGALHQWHLFFGTLLTAALLVYLAYLIKMKRFSRFSFSASDLLSKGSSGAESRLRLSMMLTLIVMMACLLTGSAQFFSIYPTSYKAINDIHQLFSVLILASLFIHALFAFWSKGLIALVNIFLPDFTKKTTLAISAVAIICLVVAGVLLLPVSQQQRLQIMMTDQTIRLDGEAHDLAWQHAPPVLVNTVNGHNFPGRQVEVSIRGLHDKTNAYFLFRWPDKSRSLKHLPLVKTEEGWTVMQTDFAHADENTFYEDKLAVMLSRTDTIAGAGTIHMGDKPLKKHPAPIGGRGLHYTADGSITDVWHWKAVRTGLSIGQADDNHFGRPLPSDSEFSRYTGGYQRDPDCEHKVRWQDGDYHLKPECGGYLANWKYYKDGILEPRRIPTNKKLVRKLAKLNLDPDAEDQGRWWMNWNETQKYDPDNDDLPVGSVIPSVLSLGPYSLGRAGIQAIASWRDGFWTLEMKRSLAVDSKYDLPIEDGIFFWVAVFNHSQTRHTYHLHPLKLELK